MTTVRFTIGLATLALGMGVAALAGIPFLIENRNIGDVVVVVGLAVGLAGLVVCGTAIPAEVAAHRRRKADREAEVELLKLTRKRLLTDKAHIVAERYNTKHRLNITVALLDREHADLAARVRQYDLENTQVDTQISMNDWEFKRRGLEPSLPDS